MAVIRDAAPDDAAAIAAVEVTSWQTAYRGLLPDDLLSNMSLVDHEHHWRERLTHRQDRSHTLVLDVDGSPQGFAAIGPPREAHADDTAAGELHALYLSPPARGRGLGAELHACALHRLRASGFERVCLWVLDNNVRARAFYERNGWVASGPAVTDTTIPGMELRKLYRSLQDAGQPTAP